MASKSVITVATTDGAWGEEIARAAAARLGYRYINDEITNRAAERPVGVDTETLPVEGGRRRDSGHSFLTPDPGPLTLRGGPS